MFSNVPLYTGFVVLGSVYIPQDNWVWGKCDVVLPETVHILGALDGGGGHMSHVDCKESQSPMSHNILSRLLENLLSIVDFKKRSIFVTYFQLSSQ